MGFIGFEGVCNDGGDDVYEGILRGTMPCVRDIHITFQDTICGFDKVSFAQQPFIKGGHEMVFHIFPDSYDKMKASCVEFFEEGRADIAFISGYFAGEVSGHIV